MEEKFSGEQSFGYITDATFELQGDFPVELIEPCSSSLLNCLIDNSYWVYSQDCKSKVFGWKNTNCIMMNALSENHGVFLVQCLSFLYGQKLVTKRLEYIDSVRLRRDCFGIGLSNKSIEKGLIYCNEIWLEISSFPDSNRQSRLKKRLFSIIHLLFMSYSNKALQFEKFMYLYMAIDACFRHLEETNAIKTNGKTRYTERIDKIFEISGIGFSEAINKKLFISIRNEMFHEGIFLDEPLGYRAVGGLFNPLFVQNYLIRLIFLILKINTVGFRSSVDSLNPQIITIQ